MGIDQLNLKLQCKAINEQEGSENIYEAQVMVKKNDKQMLTSKSKKEINDEILGKARGESRKLAKYRSWIEAAKLLEII